MKVKLNKKDNKEQFPIEIITNMGIQYFTLRAAKELKAKLDTVIFEIERSEINV